MPAKKNKNTDLLDVRYLRDSEGDTFGLLSRGHHEPLAFCLAALEKYPDAPDDHPAVYSEFRPSAPSCPAYALESGDHGAASSIVPVTARVSEVMFPRAP